MVRVLCSDLKYRVDAVDAAIRARMHQRPQPDRLPDNIYGTSGDWEVYSTPSRDARLRTAFKELRDEVARFLDLAAQGRNRLAYAGNDLAARSAQGLRAAKPAPASFTYTRSNGTQQQLSLIDVTRAAALPLVRSLPLRRAALGRARGRASSPPARTAARRPTGTRPSSACATRSTAPTMCA